ncbi:hypothetical protein DB30_05080 [Enhygromyxa salina]|uniref:Uncharacterized protein n=1 Tax=Enhygromyxa salina TaxID=215803 RepID=A0A0C2CYG1_9BACT|nr:hypothetical protein DB30_05080 [Enhygromyxa salina]
MWAARGGCLSYAGYSIPCACVRPFGQEPQKPAETDRSLGCNHADARVRCPNL